MSWHGRVAIGRWALGRCADRINPFTLVVVSALGALEFCLANLFLETRLQRHTTDRLLGDLLHALRRAYHVRPQDDQQFRLRRCLGLLPERQADDGNVAQNWNLAVRALVAIVDKTTDHHGFSVANSDGGVGAASLNDWTAEVFRNVHGLLT
jgi:hypothetical protein